MRTKRTLALALSLLLTFTLCLTVLPGRARAASDVKIAGTTLAPGGTLACGSGTAALSADGNTLTLTSAAITPTGNDVHGISFTGDLTLVLAGSSSIQGGSGVNRCAIRLGGGALTVQGSGSLTAGDSGFDTGIRSDANGSLTVKSGTLTALGSRYGASLQGSMTVDGGFVTLTGDGLSGIYIDGYSLTVTDGTVSVSGYTYGASVNSVTVSGGTLTATGDVVHGIYAGNSVTVSGGSVTAVGRSSTSDGIDAARGITVRGGRVLAQGGHRAFFTPPTLSYPDGKYLWKAGTANADPGGSYLQAPAAPFISIDAYRYVELLPVPAPVPQTGDGTPLVLFAALALLSAAALAARRYASKRAR